VGIDASRERLAAGDVDGFLAVVQARLGPVLFAYFGADRGADALAEALGYAWEHSDRLLAMDAPIGYLFRVGQSRTRWARRRSTGFPPPAELGVPDVEPRLLEELALLSGQQRTCVVLTQAYQWTHAEVAELLGLRRTTVQNHVERGLARLRARLGGDDAGPQ